MPSKSLYWFKSYCNFAELVDFAYWMSCIRKGLPCSLHSRVFFLFLQSGEPSWWGPFSTGPTPCSFVLIMKIRRESRSRLVSNQQKLFKLCSLCVCLNKYKHS